MTAVLELCTRAIIFDAGRVAFDGGAAAGVDRYLQSMHSRHIQGGRSTSTFSSDAMIARSWLERRGEPCDVFVFGDEEVDFVAVIFAPTARPLGLEIVLRDDKHNAVVFFPSSYTSKEDFLLQPGENTLRCRMPRCLLAGGKYTLDVLLVASGKAVIDHWESAISLTVEPAIIGSSRWRFTQGIERGCVMVGTVFSKSS